MIAKSISFGNIQKCVKALKSNHIHLVDLSVPIFENLILDNQDNVVGIRSTGGVAKAIGVDAVPTFTDLQGNDLRGMKWKVITHGHFDAESVDSSKKVRNMTQGLLADLFAERRFGMRDDIYIGAIGLIRKLPTHDTLYDKGREVRINVYNLQFLVNQVEEIK